MRGPAARNLEVAGGEECGTARPDEVTQVVPRPGGRIVGKRGEHGDVELVAGGLWCQLG